MEIICPQAARFESLQATAMQHSQAIAELQVWVIRLNHIAHLD
jgi:hypothetical protein